MRLGRLFLLGIVVFLMVGVPVSSLAAQGELTAWKLIDMRRPDQPDVMTQDGDSYRLQTGWEAVRIEYLYTWWGIGNDVADYQRLERVGNGYRNADANVDSTLIRDFLNALARLHPSQSVLEGQDHSDDHPMWMIEITGADGQHILLYSTSTANPGGAPWNVLYNGRLYVQYDGAIGTPLTRLFASKQGAPSEHYFGDRGDPSIIYATADALPQLTYGFVGLLPIADQFSYQIEPPSSRVRGMIKKRLFVDGFGSMISGKITELRKVEVTAQGQLVSCSIQIETAAEPADETWIFTCDNLAEVGKLADRQAYDYPILITFGTDKGETVSMEGSLQGIAHDDNAVILLPLQEELRTALAQNPEVSEILTDHVPIQVFYVAATDAVSTTQGMRSGQMILLGQTSIPEGTVRYTIGTPFEVRDGKLTMWTLTRQALQQMVKEVTTLPLTKRIMASLPTMTLNLWYAGAFLLPDPGNLVNYYPAGYWLGMEACKDMPGGAMPDGQPLRAFGFDQRWDYWLPYFVLADGEPVIYDLTLYPNSNPRHALTELLLPTQLTGMGFRAIRATHSSYRRQLPEIQFALPEDASAAEEQHLRKLVDALPVKVDVEQWFAPDSTFKVMEDGTLALFDCAAP